MGSSAFWDFSSLTSVTIILGSVTNIDSTVFDDCSKLTIHGVSGSTAEINAKNRGIPFKNWEENLETVGITNIPIHGEIAPRKGCAQFIVCFLGVLQIVVIPVKNQPVLLFVG